MNNLKEVNIKKQRTCYYLDATVKIDYFDFDNMLLYEKSYKNILVYYMSYKTLIGAKPLGIRFDKVDGSIRIYHGTRYLVLFGSEKI